LATFISDCHLIDFIRLDSGQETMKAEAMDIRLVRRTLLEIAGDESPEKPDSAIQALAVALLHVAEALEEIKESLARLVAQPVPERRPKRRQRPPKRGKHKKRGATRARPA
jgi:hypothetical protein